MNESDFDFWISVEDLVEFFETVFIAHQSSDTMAGKTCGLISANIRFGFWTGGEVHFFARDHDKPISFHY